MDLAPPAKRKRGRPPSQETIRKFQNIDHDLKASGQWRYDSKARGAVSLQEQVEWFTNQNSSSKSDPHETHGNPEIRQSQVDRKAAGSGYHSDIHVLKEQQSTSLDNFEVVHDDIDMAAEDDSNSWMDLLMGVSTWDSNLHDICPTKGLHQATSSVMETLGDHEGQRKEPKVASASGFHTDDSPVKVGVSSVCHAAADGLRHSPIFTGNPRVDHQVPCSTAEQQNASRWMDLLPGLMAAVEDPVVLHKLLAILHHPQAAEAEAPETASPCPPKEACCSRHLGNLKGDETSSGCQCQVRGEMKRLRCRSSTDCDTTSVLDRPPMVRSTATLDTGSPSSLLDPEETTCHGAFEQSSNLPPSASPDAHDGDGLAWAQSLEDIFMRGLQTRASISRVPRPSSSLLLDMQELCSQGVPDTDICSDVFGTSLPQLPTSHSGSPVACNRLEDASPPLSAGLTAAGNAGVFQDTPLQEFLMRFLYSRAGAKQCTALFPNAASDEGRKRSLLDQRGPTGVTESLHGGSPKVPPQSLQPRPRALWLPASTVASMPAPHCPSDRPHATDQAVGRDMRPAQKPLDKLVHDILMRPEMRALVQCLAVEAAASAAAPPPTAADPSSRDASQHLSPLAQRGPSRLDAYQQQSPLPQGAHTSRCNASLQDSPPGQRGLPDAGARKSRPETGESSPQAAGFCHRAVLSGLSVRTLPDRSQRTFAGTNTSPGHGSVPVGSASAAQCSRRASPEAISQRWLMEVPGLQRTPSAPLGKTASDGGLGLANKVLRELQHMPALRTPSSPASKSMDATIPASTSQNEEARRRSGSGVSPVETHPMSDVASPRPLDSLPYSATGARALYAAEKYPMQPNHERSREATVHKLLSSVQQSTDKELFLITRVMTLIKELRSDAKGRPSILSPRCDRPHNALPASESTA